MQNLVVVSQSKRTCRRC